MLTAIDHLRPTAPAGSEEVSRRDPVGNGLEFLEEAAAPEAVTGPATVPEPAPGRPAG
ncbi:hypothetical protein [Streptomyces sp. NPDC051776]|uniref:hypothetical protein n=1 Tax=Streptomyces sp. NPDC051776 TaxID=3155414 RepID=UPI00343AD723